MKQELTLKNSDAEKTSGIILPYYAGRFHEQYGSKLEFLSLTLVKTS